MGYVAQKARGRVYVTHHQADEINNTPKEARRTTLMGCLQEINPDLMPTKTCIVNTLRLGMAQIGDGGCYRDILKELDRRHSKNSNKIDALIGETAEKNGCVLVSDNRIFSCVMRARGVRVVGWLSLLRNSHLRVWRAIDLPMVNCATPTSPPDPRPAGACSA